MLKWCSYCQRFIGERPPYEDLGLTHGVCAACESKALAFTDRDVRFAHSLRNIQSELYAAGQRGDMQAAGRMIEVAAAANIRDVDILVGIIAPMLYRIGEDWKRNLISVATEHRFTAFCHELFERIAGRPPGWKPTRAVDAQTCEVLLMNSPGNRHTLAIRILTLWLRNKGVAAQMVDETPCPRDVVALVRNMRPKLLLLSMALPEQSAGVATIAARVAELPSSMRPRVIVGGNAVKLGLVSAIPGAGLIADISALGALV